MLHGTPTLVLSLLTRLTGEHANKEWPVWASSSAEFNLTWDILQGS